MLCIALVSGSLMVPLGSVAETSGQIVPASDPLIQYSGAWRMDGNECYTIYPGSQLRFRLMGRARIAVRSGLAGCIRVAVRKEGQVIWDGILSNDIDVDSGTVTQTFSLVYLDTKVNGFDAGTQDARGAELRFRGIIRGPDSVLVHPPEYRSDFGVEFLGDSITAGVNIHGRNGSWSEHSDASLAFAFLLAEKLDVAYWIRGYPGASCSSVRENVPFFRRNMPVDHWNPDVVFVNIAANDREMRSAEYGINMRKLLDAIFEVHPAAKIVLLNFCRMTPDRFPILQDLARSFGNAHVLCFDSRPYLVGYSDEGVHPDVESHAKLAAALDGYMRHAFKIPVAEAHCEGPKTY